MVTVITHELLLQGDVNAIMESTGSEYVHVASKAPKVSVVNLGMSADNFKAFKPINALNVFGKQFNPSTVEKLNSDLCIISDGVLDAAEAETLVAKISTLVGKIPVIGIGAGKELLLTIAAPESGWTTKEGISNHAALNLYGLDCYSQLSKLELF